MRKPLLAIIAIAVGASSLTACGSSVEPWNITTDAGFSKVVCDKVVDVRNTLADLKHAAASDDRDEALEAWGFTSASDKRINTVDTKLDSKEKSKECSDNKEPEAPAPSASPTVDPTDSGNNAKPGNNGKAKVKDNGTTKVVPVVDEAGEVPTTDTTRDPMTPPSLPAGLCPTLKNWKTLTDCVEKNHFQWYIDEVNQREASTGFDWRDIKRASKAKNLDAEVRAIMVFGKGISNAEARKRAAELVGQKAAKFMAIVRQPACFNNTRGLEDGVMQDFVYCPPNSRQVRVSLLPVVMKKGKIVALRNTDSGVFVDCDNVWWIPDLIKVPGRPPQTNVPVPNNPTPLPGPTPSTPGGGGGCVDCDTNTEKDIRESYLSNPKVRSQKKGSNGGAPNNNNGAKDPRGIQHNPQGDAQEAKQEADKVTEQKEEVHQKEKEEATVDNPNKGKTEAPDPPADW